MPLHTEKYQRAALDRPVGKLRRTVIAIVVTASPMTRGTNMM